MSKTSTPLRLKPRFVERIWGRTDLSPWYSPLVDATDTGPVGEAWLTGSDCVIANGEWAGSTLKTALGEEFPLLVKMLFPADKLSLQVHPNDSEARALGLERGKTECWYVLEAEPGATVACGLQPGVSAQDFAAAIASGQAESLMDHLPVTVGDMIFVDAGTVHAIGPGLILLEVQQTCDITYRLYDYGRPRELHLEAGLAVLKTVTQAGKVAPIKMDGFTRLIATEYFVVDRFEVPPGGTLTLPFEGAGCLVGLSGHAHIGGLEARAGEAIVFSPGLVHVATDEGFVFVRCAQPSP